MKKIIREENGRTRVITMNTRPSRTQQQFKDQCDVNNIMKKFNSTGQISHVNSRQGSFADFSHIKDYHTSLQTVLDAQNSFQSLPATLRDRFKNDPAQLLEFLNNPQNAQEAIDLGLLSEEATQKHRPKRDDKQNDDAITADKTVPPKQKKSASPES